MSENNQQKKTYSRHHSLFGPLLLIAAGVLFLLNNLGVIPGDFWDVLLNLWPLLIIFAGIDGLVRREGIAWPTMLIVLGTFLLIRNLDIMDWQGWGRLWQLWPVILVALGVDLIFKDSPLWRAVFGVGMVLLLVGGGIWLVGFSSYMGGSLPVGDSLPMDAHQALGEGVSQAGLTFSLGAGELHLGGGAAKGLLVAGQVFPQTGYERYDENDGAATYTLESDSPRLSPTHGRWDLGLTTRIPLDLKVEMGAGNMVLSLVELQVENLVIEQGVGNIEIRLPARGLLQLGVHHVEVSQAVGQIQLTIPQGAAIRLEVSRAISALDIPHNFSRSGDYYFSPNYDEAEGAIELKISQAIGRIEIEYGH